jgi:hypothetical protein
MVRPDEHRDLGGGRPAHQQLADGTPATRQVLRSQRELDADLVASARQVIEQDLAPIRAPPPVEINVSA